jgi:FkbM family methyltransferase
MVDSVVKSGSPIFFFLNMVLDLAQIVKKYSVDPSHVVHAGAHVGQELALYDSIGVKECWLFEPQPDVYAKLIEAAKPYSWARLHSVGLGSRHDTLEMTISEGNEGQSSSFLEPGLHVSQFRHVKFGAKKKLAKIVPLESLLNKYRKFKPKVLCMDTQGYELEVLKGIGHRLSEIQLVVTEFTTDQLYKGNVVLRDLDTYLKFYGFRRVETKAQGHNWGDAAYISL